MAKRLGVKKKKCDSVCVNNTTEINEENIQVLNNEYISNALSR